MSYYCDVGFVTSAKGYKELEKILLEEDYELMFYADDLSIDSANDYAFFRIIHFNVLSKFNKYLRKGLVKLKELNLSYFFISIDRDQCDGHYSIMENDGKYDCGLYRLPHIVDYHKMILIDGDEIQKEVNFLIELAEHKEKEKIEKKENKKVEDKEENEDMDNKKPKSAIEELKEFIREHSIK